MSQFPLHVFCAKRTAFGLMVGQVYSAERGAFKLTSGQHGVVGDFLVTLTKLGKPVFHQRFEEPFSAAVVMMQVWDVVRKSTYVSPKPYRRCGV